MGVCLVDEFQHLRLWWDGELTRGRLRDGVWYSLDQYWPQERDWIGTIQQILLRYNMPGYHNLHEGVSEIVRILWDRDIFERFDPTRCPSFFTYYRGIVDNALNNLRVTKNRLERESDRDCTGGHQDGWDQEPVSYVAKTAVSAEVNPADNAAFFEALRLDLAEIHARLVKRFSVNLGIHCTEVFVDFEERGIPNSKSGFMDACSAKGIPRISGVLLWPHYYREFRALVAKYFVRKPRGKKVKGPKVICLEVKGRVGHYCVLARGLFTTRVVKIELYEQYLQLVGTGGRKGVLDPSLRILNEEITRGIVTEIVDFSRKFR